MYKFTGNTSKEFWVIFKSGDLWYQRYLRDGFGHCIVMFKDDFNWIVLDPTISCLKTVVLPYDVSENVPGMYAKKDRHTVLRVNSSIDPSKKTNMLITIPSCMTVVSYIMGVKIFALTPHILYKKLMSMTGYSNRSKRRRIKSNIDTVRMVY